MINYHPSKAVLKEFVAGNMPVSISLIIASHVEMCRECQILVESLTEEAALQAFDMHEEQSGMNDFEGYADECLLGVESDNILNAIVVESAEQQILPELIDIEVQATKVTLPRALNSISLTEWQGVGKISRARLNIEDAERRMSLLHIAKNGKVPPHTHKGYEITLLLQGSFEDEMGQYQAGDFIWLDGSHTHHPVTHEGCICLTVSSDALHFTQGISQLFNPLGKLIY